MSRARRFTPRSRIAVHAARIQHERAGVRSRRRDLGGDQVGEVEHRAADDVVDLPRGGICRPPGRCAAVPRPRRCTATIEPGAGTAIAWRDDIRRRRGARPGRRARCWGWPAAGCCVHVHQRRLRQAERTRRGAGRQEPSDDPGERGHCRRSHHLHALHMTRITLRGKLPGAYVPFTGRGEHVLIARRRAYRLFIAVCCYALSNDSRGANAMDALQPLAAPDHCDLHHPSSPRSANRCSDTPRPTARRSWW